MARPSHDQTQILEQRSRMIAAALGLYRHSGYEAVTLRSLAAQLGISHTTPYRYFKSKEELFSSLRTDVWTRFADRLEQAGSIDAPPIERLRSICLGAIEFALHYPEDYRLIFSMSQPPAASNTPLHDARLRAERFVISVCQQAIDAGQLKGDARTWAHIAWASLHGLLSLHVSNLLVLGRDLEHLVEPILQTLLTGSSSDKKQPRKKNR